MTDRRDFLTLLAGVAAVASTDAKAAENTATAIPPFVQRGQPGRFHAAVRSLQGEWLVDKEIYIAVGSPQAPAKSSGMVAQRYWVAGGRHLHDVTQGALAGSPYYRLGVLGFSNIDSRYEWVTFDGLNSNLMLYRSARLDQPARRIDMSGVFTDQGLLGEQFAGKEIPMRTVLDIQSENKHLIELYFTPPGRTEQLIDRSIYTRM